VSGSGESRVAPGRQLESVGRSGALHKFRLKIDVGLGDLDHSEPGHDSPGTMTPQGFRVALEILPGLLSAGLPWNQRPLMPLVPDPIVLSSVLRNIAEFWCFPKRLI